MADKNVEPAWIQEFRERYKIPGGPDIRGPESKQPHLQEAAQAARLQQGKGWPHRIHQYVDMSPTETPTWMGVREIMEPVFKETHKLWKEFEFGKPVMTSGVRDVLTGHGRGVAADFSMPKGITPNQLQRWVTKMRGLGMGVRTDPHGTGIHLHVQKKIGTYEHHPLAWIEDVSRGTASDPIMKNMPYYPSNVPPESVMKNMPDYPPRFGNVRPESVMQPMPFPIRQP